jgi:hypothetical protein
VPHVEQAADQRGAIIGSAETPSKEDHRQEDIDTSGKITLSRMARLPSPLVIKRAGCADAGHVGRLLVHKPLSRLVAG